MMRQWDRDIIEGLYRATNKGGLCLFVGAGLSIQVGYPSWEDLINKMVEVHIKNPTVDKRASKDIKRMVKNGDNVLNCLSMIFDQNPRDVKNVMESSFTKKRDKNYSDNHIKLLGLVGLKGIVTTNYDNCLEDALQMCDKPFNNVSSFVEFHNPSKMPIFHLHGKIDNFNTVILTGAQYTEYYTDALKSEIRNFLIGNAVLYLGYGFGDKQIVQILEQKALIERSSPGQIDHYALMPYVGRSPSPVQKQLYKNSYGINVQYYCSNSAHIEFDNLIDELAGKLAASSSASEVIPKEVR